MKPRRADSKTLTTPIPAMRSSRDHARRLVRGGSWIVLSAVAPLCAWICFAPLSMAVVAPAVVKVDLNRRPVQHLEGGIVLSVRVRDGQHVSAGDVVLTLGDVRVDADRNRLAYRVSVERAALVRLEAEQTLARQLAFPGELVAAAQADDRIQQALAKEAALFEARRDALNSEVGLLTEQRGRVTQEIAALLAEIATADSSLALQRKELEANRGLLEDGFISPTRVTQIEAVVMDYAAKLEERRSELARAQQRMLDCELKIQSIQNDYMQAASDLLKDTSARLNEIEQELRKLEDAAARQVVTAPASGEVIDLKFTSPGAVVQPGETIAEIVPSNAPLMVEAQVRPEEISHVRYDQRARVKFTAFKYRNSLTAVGKVTYISADRLVDRATNVPYYSVMILADPDALRAAGGIKLHAGMPAEVYIEGPKQTPLQYLVEPITSTVRKAGRQM
jgi:HlyD family secretion protein